MAAGGVGAFIFRHKRIAWLRAFFGGVWIYYTCLSAIVIVMPVIDHSTTKQGDLGWFLVICIFFLPRALLSSALGLLCWEAFRFFIKKLPTNQGSS